VLVGDLSHDHKKKIEQVEPPEFSISLDEFRSNENDVWLHATGENFDLCVLHDFRFLHTDSNFEYHRFDRPDCFEEQDEHKNRN
jgi:hypothetical protein